MREDPQLKAEHERPFRMPYSQCLVKVKERRSKGIYFGAIYEGTVTDVKMTGLYATDECTIVVPVELTAAADATMIHVGSLLHGVIAGQDLQTNDYIVCAAVDTVEQLMANPLNQKPPL